MQKVFLDTNVLLDFVLDRKPFSDYAEKIIASGLTHKKHLFVSALSLANIAYIVRKARKSPVSVIQELMTWTDVVNLTKHEFQQALKSGFKDFEDALQFYCAQHIQTDVIVTRNTRDYSTSSILVQTPLQFLKSLES